MDKIAALMIDAVEHPSHARQRIAALEAEVERMRKACEALVEQVRHDNESEATYRAVDAEFGAFEWEAFMPSAWHEGRAALEPQKGKSNEAV